MNAKTIYWIGIISTICIGSIVAGIYYNRQSEVTTTAQCTIENPVWCDEQIDKLQVEYNNLSKLQSEISKRADVYRAIKRLEISPSIQEQEKLSKPNQ